MKPAILNITSIFGVLSDLPEDEWKNIILMGGQADVDWLVNHVYNTPGPKWCFATEAGMVNLMGGLIPARPGVYRSWCFATNWAWKNIPGEVTAAVAEVVRQSLLAGAHRIETVCYATRHNALKWYESLGLRYESTMKGYCVDGTDAVMYVATKELH